MSRRHVILSLVAGLYLASCAASESSKPRTAFVPPEQGLDWAQARLNSFGEPSFYQPSDAKTYRSRHRLTVSGVACFEFVVRVDEGMTGHLSGMVKHRNRCEGQTAFDQHLLRPSSTRLAAVKAKIKAAGLFEHYPEAWWTNDADGSICVDGMELIFERLNANGHGYSQANAPCTAPAKLRDIVDDFCAISKDDNVKGFCDRYL